MATIVLSRVRLTADTSGNVLTVLGTGTGWTPGAPGFPVFTLAGGAATVASQTITSPTQATLTITTGNQLGPVTVTDPSTGATASFTVVRTTTLRWFRRRRHR